MFESGRKKRPHEDLFVTNKYGCVVIADADCSTGKELQWHPLITEGPPHCNWNRNALLIERCILLAACEQHIQVPLLSRRISRRAWWVDSSSQKHCAVLRSKRGYSVSPKSIRGFIPVREQMFREEEHGRMRLENRCLHGLGRVVFGREVGVSLSCAPLVCVAGFPSRRDLRLRVLEMKDECTEHQTDDTQRWLEAV